MNRLWSYALWVLLVLLENVCSILSLSEISHLPEKCYDYLDYNDRGHFLSFAVDLLHLRSQNLNKSVEKINDVKSKNSI